MPSQQVSMCKAGNQKQNRHSFQFPPLVSVQHEGPSSENVSMRAALFGLYTGPWTRLSLQTQQRKARLKLSPLSPSVSPKLSHTLRPANLCTLPLACPLSVLIAQRKTAESPSHLFSLTIHSDLVYFT